MAEQNRGGGNQTRTTDPDTPGQLRKPREKGTRDEAQQKDSRQTAGKGPPGGQNDGPGEDQIGENR